MIIKEADSKNQAIATLRNLLKSTDSYLKKKAIEKEIRIMQAGIKGEKESAYMIDFNFGGHKNFVVIHDLRLEANGRVAQIDHLIINRGLKVYVLETKHFSSGIKITEEGEFLYWNDFDKKYTPIPSPIEQNKRHIEVLKDAFSAIELPTRLGLKIKPTFESYILVNNKAKVYRPKKKNFNTDEVIKPDLLFQKVKKGVENTGVLGTIALFSKLMFTETVAEIGKELCKQHKPITVDYEKKFKVKAVAPSDSTSAKKQEAVEQKEPNNQKCSKCNSNNITLNGGKFGYYFKCSDCNGNTTIKTTCGIEGRTEKIKKKGKEFFKECDQCKSKSLFFTNPS